MHSQKEIIRNFIPNSEKFTQNSKFLKKNALILCIFRTIWLTIQSLQY